MNQLPSDLIVRSPAEADAQAVVDLMTACEIAEYGEADASLEDVLDEWADIDLAQDAWLVYTSSGQLTGYAALFCDHTTAIDFYTLAGPGQVDLNGYLLARCEERLREIAGGEKGPVTVETIVPHTDAAGRQAAEAAGFAPRHYYFRMQVETDATAPLLPWPEGLTLRTIVPGQDDHEVYTFIQTAFERPGRVAPTFEQWQDFMMRADHFRPDLWFLLYDQAELVGAALCFDYPTYGWVRQLAVAQKWRRRGLGAALLQYVFAIFGRGGHVRVALAVDSDNPNAVQFYEKVGMRCVRQYDAYRKTL